jgi:hypothetical protein
MSTPTPNPSALDHIEQRLMEAVSDREAAASTPAEPLES